MVTPLVLKILLHHYVSPSPFENYDFDVVRESHALLCDHGMIEPDERVVRDDEPNKSGWRITKKGRYYVEYLLSIPFPQEVFVIPHSPDKLGG